MKRQLWAVFAVALLALIVGRSVALAQVSAPVEIPFTFSAGEKEMPAGKYKIRVADGTEKRLLLERADNGERTNISILTRVSDRGETKMSLVFDKAEGKAYLAEVYLPGMDGFHLQGAPGKHTHTKVEQK